MDADAILRVCHGRRTEETVAEFLPADRRADAVARLDELELAELDDVVACPGAAELLGTLTGDGGGSGDPWAVVTACSVPLVVARTKAAGLTLPPVLVTAEEVMAGKPDPESYLLAASRLGLHPAECVVVEDAPAGVRAGRAAGATVVAVTTTHDAAELTEADAVVPSLGHLHVTRRTTDLLLRTR